MACFLASSSRERRVLFAPIKIFYTRKIKRKSGQGGMDTADNERITKVDDERAENADTKNTPRRVNKWSFPYVKAIVIPLLSGIVLYFGLKLYYGLFVADPQYYANYFYNWRINHADPLMTTETYKDLPPNAYSKKRPEQRAMAEYVAMAQGTPVAKGKPSREREGLLNMGFVEHLPRGNLHYHTHSNKVGFIYNEMYLRFRKSVILAIKSEDLYGGKVRKTNHFVIDEKKRESFDVVEILKSHLYVANFIVSLESLLDYMYKHEDIHSNKTSHAEFLERSRSLVKAGACNKDFSVSDDRIQEFIKNNGTISVAPQESFFYSRGFYAFQLATLKVDLEGISAKEGPKRALTVARIYAKILTSAFEKPLLKDPKVGFMKRKLGRDVTPDYTSKKMKAEMTEVMKNDQENTQRLLAEFKRVATASSASLAAQGFVLEPPKNK